jgi:D-inositol-3-phosphate glycosyltransferase
MPYYYNASDVCAVPSYYESFGLVAIESLACGTPVVANNVGDLRNIIRQGENGYVVENNEPETLAGKINLILNKPDGKLLAPSFIRESVSDFTWSNIADSLASQFQRVLDNYYLTLSYDLHAL